MIIFLAKQHLKKDFLQRFLAKQLKSTEHKDKSNLCHPCAPWIRNTAPLDNKERCDDEGMMVKKKTED